MLDCAQVSADLVALLDGELSALEAEAVHTHFAGCARCSRTYDALREQLVVFQWAGEGFVFDPPDLDALPGLEGLQSRLSGADLDQLGKTLYEILKAQFLYVYGEGLEPDAAPVSDLEAERRRGVELVEELRDWHDEDQVQGVELLSVRDRMTRPEFAADQVELFIQGMAEVGRMAPALSNAALYWQAIAHIKARRQAEATALFERLGRMKDEPLARPARICLATVPVLFGQAAAEVMEGLRACLKENPDDPIVLFNLAKAGFLNSGALDAAAAEALGRAREIAPEMVERELARPSEAPFRAAVSAL